MQRMHLITLFSRLSSRTHDHGLYNNSFPCHLWKDRFRSTRECLHIEAMFKLDDALLKDLFHRSLAGVRITVVAFPMFAVHGIDLFHADHTSL